MIARDDLLEDLTFLVLDAELAHRQDPAILCGARTDERHC
jgi:hypothetical protein